MNAKANAAYRLADHRALLESIIDALNAVVLHADQEARAELRMRCSCIEESWGGVDEVSLRHIGVCLSCAFDVVAVNADSDAHEHVLRPFSDLAIETKEIRAFEGLEAEVLIMEFAFVDDGRVEEFGALHDRFVHRLADHTSRDAVLGIYLNSVRFWAWHDRIAAYHNCTGQ